MPKSAPARSRRPVSPARGSRSRALAANFLAFARRPRVIAIGAACLAVGAIWSNALFLQPGKHPTPFVATRSVPQTQDAASVGSITSVAMLRAIQVELARTGYYAGPIDGRSGPATEKAIRAFEAEIGLAGQGAATPDLLERLRGTESLDVRMASTAGIEELASLEDRMGAIPVPDDRAMPPEKDTVAVNASARAEPADRSLVKRIQSGLSSAKVADLAADGIVGERTRAAIRTFEELEGMQVTGEPTRDLLERLVEIGALSNETE